MTKTKETAQKDASTEEKIKSAARTVFQSKGYAATRTRDIAEEAGINLALLNYYFRSKEKLFEIIMIETLVTFFRGMIGVLDNNTTTFEKKIELIALNYLDMCSSEPNIPLFILSEIRNRPKDLFDKLPIQHFLTNSVFVRQFQKKVATRQIKEPNILHFMMNMLGLIVFPFVARPFVMALGTLKDAQFNQMMQERKKMIPIWIKAMMKAC